MIFREGPNNIKRLATEVPSEPAFNFSDELAKVDVEVVKADQQRYLDEKNLFNYLEVAALARQLGLPVVPMDKTARKKLKETVQTFAKSWRGREPANDTIELLRDVLLLDKDLIAGRQKLRLDALEVLDISIRIDDLAKKINAADETNIFEILCLWLNRGSEVALSPHLDRQVQAITKERLSDVHDRGSVLAILEVHAILKLTTDIEIPTPTSADIAAVQRALPSFKNSHATHLQTLFYLKVLLSDSIGFDEKGNLHIDDPSPMEQQSRSETPLPPRTHI